MMMLVLTIPSLGFAQETKRVWNWSSNGITNKFVNKPQSKVLFPPPPATIVRSQADINVERSARKFESLKEFKPDPVFPRPYHVSPMQQADGSFYSPRYLDYDLKAAENFKVSGAAIYSYGLRSMYERNQLERRLDLERSSWQARKHYYLHNNTPWLRSK